MLVDPNNRLVADTLEHEWNDKLRTLANAREERERSQQQDRLARDDAIRERLIAMITDFKTLWRDQSLPNRERKRLLAHIIEDVTLVKLPQEGTTRIQVRFKARRTETLTAQNPKSSAQQVKTRPEVLELIDELLDSHTCSEIADIVNNQGIRPSGCVRPGKSDIRFTALRVSYVAQRNGLRSFVATVTFVPRGKHGFTFRRLYGQGRLVITHIRIEKPGTLEYVKTGIFKGWPVAVADRRRIVPGSSGKLTPASSGMIGCASVSEYFWNSFGIAWAKAFRLLARTGPQRRLPTGSSRMNA
ncbi:hypothetical protein OKW35_005202 [Paraburkholderia sp. MM5477-R1]